VINPAGHANTWGTGQGTPLFRISPARGSRSMAKVRLRSYGLRRTRMGGVSFGRGGENNNVDFKARCGESFMAGNDQNIRFAALFSWTIHGQNDILNKKGLWPYSLSP